MKKFLSILTLSLSPILSTLAMAGGGTGTSEGPINWGPWYLYQANNYTLTIECVYKRKEIKEGAGSIRTETKRVVIGQYGGGSCPATLVN